jgi:undecaprenyl pyrophosphate phosphatase UppP
LRPSRLRVRLETAIAAVAGVLGILTIFWHDWIEALTGWDPDHHNGSFEWIIIVALLAVAVVVGAMARRDWRSSVALERE